MNILESRLERLMESLAYSYETRAAKIAERERIKEKAAYNLREAARAYDNALYCAEHGHDHDEIKADKSGKGFVCKRCNQYYWEDKVELALKAMNEGMRKAYSKQANRTLYDDTPLSTPIKQKDDK